jgi:hypothetical protein
MPSYLLELIRRDPGSPSARRRTGAIARRLLDQSATEAQGIRRRLATGREGASVDDVLGERAREAEGE